MKSKKSKISLKWSLVIAGIAFSSVVIFFLPHYLSGQNSYANLASSTSSETQPLDLPSQVSYTQSISPITIQTHQNLVKDMLVEPIRSIAFPEQAISGHQMRLKIPKINVDALVESIGLTSQGALDVPKDPADVGWYDLGPRPGEMGSAVIDGHFGWWKNGTPTVFNDLNKLEKGDKIYVEDETGETATFVVRESRSYDPNADASDVFGSNDAKSHLNLITCEGVWDESAKHYSKRLVVFADK